MPVPASPSLLRNRTRGVVLARRVYQPVGAWEWALGLLVRPPLLPGEALWLNPCGGIHTWGMRYPIDVVFLDADHIVLKVARAVKPWRLVFAPRGTRSVLELPAANHLEARPGDQLAFEVDE